MYVYSVLHNAYSVVFMITATQYNVEKIQFAKLRDLKQIGEGGFGEVYFAKHSDWGPVAFKRLLVTFIKEHDRYCFKII